MTLFAAWALALAITSPSGPEPALPVVIVVPAASATASVAAHHLSIELGGELPREVTSGTDPQDALAQARSKWPDQILIYLHPEQHEAWMLRPGSDEPVVRRLQNPPESPSYPLAIVAAELVRNAVTRPEDPPRSPFALAFSLGLGLTGGGGDEGMLLHPVFGLDLRLRSDRLWSFAGLRLRGPGASTFDAVSATEIDYRRTDLVLRLGLGPELASWVLSAFLEAGLSSVSVEAKRNESSLGSSDRWAFGMGAGVEARRPIDFGFGVYLCAGFLQLFEPADFSGDGEALFSEGRWRVQGQAGVEWAL